MERKKFILGFEPGKSSQMIDKKAFLSMLDWLNQQSVISEYKPQYYKIIKGDTNTSVTEILVHLNLTDKVEVISFRVSPSGFCYKVNSETVCLKENHYVDFLLDLYLQMRTKTQVRFLN